MATACSWVVAIDIGDHPDFRPGLPLTLKQTGHRVARRHDVPQAVIWRILNARSCRCPRGAEG